MCYSSMQLTLFLTFGELNFIHAWQANDTHTMQPCVRRSEAGFVLYQLHDSLGLLHFDPFYFV